MRGVSVDDVGRAPPGAQRIEGSRRRLPPNSAIGADVVHPGTCRAQTVGQPLAHAGPALAMHPLQQIVERADGLIDLGVLYSADRVAKYLSHATVELLERVLGILLGALAIELIVVGLSTLGIIGSTAH